MLQLSLTGESFLDEVETLFRRLEQEPLEQRIDLINQIRRIVLLRNDYWCKGLGQAQPKSKAYQQFLEMKRQGLLRA